jgi:dihydrodipicolinate synthase/N-acetylneuraminate lyase
MTRLRLPKPDGTIVTWEPSGAAPVTPRPGGFRSRVAYAATHVVADPLVDPVGIDWEATVSLRRYMWSLGLGVAEAMDTAQRGMGLEYHEARSLIEHTLEAADGAPTVCGVATDQLASDASLGAVAEAYLEQLEHVESLGGRAIVMASRQLAAAARSADEYLEVYRQVLEAARRPVMIHWLGDIFDPALTGYWGSVDPWVAMETLVGLVRSRSESVDGIKISLLDASLETEMRRRLPDGVRVYTGDDFNYVDLILGDDSGHSDAMLGAFDPAAPAAAGAIQALDDGDTDRYRELLEPTLALSRHVFAAPTWQYKTGVVFLAWLNGHQRHFRMLDGAESARSVPHLAEAMVLADQARLLIDPELATRRMASLLAVAGIE